MGAFSASSYLVIKICRMIILIINVLLKPSTSSSLVASFLSSWRYIFIWPNHYHLSYLTQSLSFIASARNNNRCSSSSFFFLSYYSLSRRTWLRLLRDLFNAKKFWRDKNTAKKFLRHKVMATKLLRGPQNHWEMKLWQQNCISKFSTSEEAGNTRLR